VVVQLHGLYLGFANYLRTFAFDDVLPPSVIRTINWVLGLLPKALGVRNTTPRTQINANIVFIFFWGSISILSLGLTAPVILIHLILLTIGVLRWMPAFGELWNGFRSRLPIKSDYDIPRWRSE